MPRYKVMIHGRNFLLNLDGTWEKSGFLTPRFADASDAFMAKHVVLEDFKQSEKYRILIETSLNSSDDPYSVEAEDIEEVAADAKHEKGLPGLIFYPSKTE